MSYKLYIIEYTQLNIKPEMFQWTLTSPYDALMIRYVNILYVTLDIKIFDILCFMIN